MRLKKSRAAAEEQLVSLVTEGYEVLSNIRADFAKKSETNSFDEARELPGYQKSADVWGQKVVKALEEVFPTQLEAHSFLNPEQPFGAVTGPHRYNSFVVQIQCFVRGLNSIIEKNFARYTDLPIHGRLFVEDIDSFRKVRDINPSVVAFALRKGRVDLLEDQVQMAFEQILEVSFHRRDWGGESNDLYTANVIINGARIPTAFILKGRGCTSPELRIADCGSNGDQILRLLESPADLFVIQYVGPVSDAVIKDIEGKTNELRSRGRNAYYCVIDGQDTARVLQAYGKLPVSSAN